MGRPGIVTVLRVLFRPPGRLGPAVVGIKALLLPLTRARRRRLSATTFIGVTGSAGKTTATHLLDAILATRGPVAPRRGGPAQAWRLVKTIFTTTRRHHACVHELAISGPKMLDELLWTLEPDVAVVTTVGFDHWRAFGTHEAIGPEKAKVVAAVPPEGLAVLNADDPLVRGMNVVARCPVLLYGRSPDAMVRAEDVGVDGSGRLLFTLVYDGVRVPVTTQLQGELWLTSALAALATGLALGIAAPDAVRAVADVEPVLHRLSVLRTAGGITFLRDDWKGASWTVRPALEALATMPARRRIAVLGELPDDLRRARVFYRDIAREARRTADLVVLVGQKARHGLRARTGEDDRSFAWFAGAPEAAEFLRTRLGEGDVVLIKANRIPEHLERVALSNVFPVTCKRVRCTKRVFCDDCRLLTRRTSRRDGTDAPPATRPHSATTRS